MVLSSSIKLETGAKDLVGHHGEKITEGLDGLRDRLAELRFLREREMVSHK
jgi:fructose-bisphosphate aldolase class I